MISFITTAKICKGYEWIEDSLQIYIDCIMFFCDKYNINYEILIGEDLDSKNIKRIELNGNFKIIEVPQIYHNQLGFNMIESYGKNACLSQSKGDFVCMTSADQLFSESFFIFIKNSLYPNTFYRFATYEIPKFDTKSLSIIEIIQKCNDSNSKLCNPGCFSYPLDPIKLGQKSGDIMLLDRLSFEKIKGWPENDCFVHVDCSVCFVAFNNFNIFVPPNNICSYTFEQEYREPQEKFLTTGESYNQYQWRKCLSYSDKLLCN